MAMKDPLPPRFSQGSNTQKSGNNTAGGGEAAETKS